MSNEVILMGTIVSNFTYDHCLYGETFYNVTLCVKRDSGNKDSIPLLISDRLIDINKNLIGACVSIRGEFRSHNKHDEDKNRLKLYVFVNSIELLAENNNINDVFIEGYICKNPIYRHTPLGRRIADAVIAVNREYNKSAYIPCIFWGRNAHAMSLLRAGDRIRVAGRIQNRDYIKNGESKTAYELSVNLLEIC